MRVVLVGGRSSEEARMGAAIAAAAQTALVDQIGKDTLPQLLGLMSQSTVLLSPDSGPAHMASMVGLPVIGLYAPPILNEPGPTTAVSGASTSTTPRRANSWASPPRKSPGRRNRTSGVMDLIAVNDATAKLDALILAQDIR